VWVLKDKYVLTQASANRLMFWSGPEKAAQQLSTNVPGGKIEAVSTTAAHLNLIVKYHGETVIFAVTRGKDWNLLRINFSAGEVRHQRLQTSFSPGDQAAKALIVDECAFLIARQSIEAFSLETGELLSKLPLDKYTPLEFVGNRYLKDRHGRGFRLSFDGEIHLTLMKQFSASPLLIDPDGLPLPQGEYPVCVSRLGGKLIGGRKVPLFQEALIQRAWQAGSLIMLHGTFKSLNSAPCYSQEATAVWDLSHDPWAWKLDYAPVLEVVVRNLAAEKLRPRQGLRHKFTMLSCTENRICLRSTRQWWQFEFRQDRLRLIGVAAPRSSDGQIGFERLAWPGLSIPFRSLKLPNGNEVWLDGRGLMHLMPARSDLPEITLVLDEDNVSGWMSTGLVFGDPYYLEDGLPTASPLRVWTDHITSFFGVAS
jgi:hypothetical protein